MARWPGTEVGEGIAHRGKAHAQTWAMGEGDSSGRGFVCLAGRFRRGGRLTAPFLLWRGCPLQWARGPGKGARGIVLGDTAQPAARHPARPWGTLAASLPLRFPWEVTFERLHGSPSLGNSSFGYLRES